MERRAKRNEWFKGTKKKKNETVLFVPTTPGGELRKRYLEKIEEAKSKIAVAEIPARNTKSIQK